MKQYKLIILTFLLSNLGCNGQQKTDTVNNIKNTTMEKFDIMRFNENKKNDEYNFMLNDGTVVRQIENRDSEDYIEEKRTPPGVFTKIRSFFFVSGNLKIAGEKFYNFPIGKWQYFEESGNLVKETDWEERYKFTLAELVKKMKETGIDLLVKSIGVNVFRSSVGDPLYTVMYPVGSSPYVLYKIKINGITGEVLEKISVKTRK